MKSLTKKNCSVMGMICGLLVIVLGIVILAGGLDGNTYGSSASYSSSPYDSGFAAFGGDFYTYIVNNAAEAASAARAASNAAETAANNVHYFADFVRTVFGAAMIVFGLFQLCLFGVKYGECVPVVEAKAPVAEENAEKPAESAEKPAEPAEKPAEEEAVEAAAEASEEAAEAAAEESAAD